MDIVCPISEHWMLVGMVMEEKEEREGEQERHGRTEEVR